MNMVNLAFMYHLANAFGQEAFAHLSPSLRRDMNFRGLCIHLIINWQQVLREVGNVVSTAHFNHTLKIN